MNETMLSALWLLAQATMVLAAGLAGSLALRARPAVAHAVLVAAMIGLLLLPLASIIAGTTGWGLLPPLTPDARSAGDDARSSARTPPDAVPGVSESRADPLVTAPASVRSTPPAGVTAPASERALAAVPGSDAAPPGFARDELADALARPALAPSASVPPAQAVRAAMFAWAAVSSVLLARVALGVRASVRVRRGSRAAEHPAAAAALRRAAMDQGLTEPIELGTSARVRCPVISCWGRPRLVLLPNSAASAEVDWNGVMAHELAHLRRRDHVSALVAELVVCLLPWHPLAWLARRELGVLAERACDDWALRCATNEASYAGSLMAFMPSRSAGVWAPAFVSRRGVGARIGRILSGRRVPAAVGRPLGAAVCLLTIGSVVAAALARPRAGEPDAIEPPTREPSSRRPRQPDVPRKSAPAPSPQDVDAQIAALLDYWRESASKPRRSRLWELAGRLGQSGDARAIPPMIGIISADNSYDTVYGVGYFGLYTLTKVHYSPFHDGAWWRRWWEQNKASYPEAARATPIPDLPRSQAGAAHVDYPEALDTFEGRIDWLVKAFNDGREKDIDLMARDLAALGDPRAIPTMIGILDADNSRPMIANVGGALATLAGIKPSSYHDGAWWRRWWEANKAQFPAAASIPIPPFPKTDAGRQHENFPESMDTAQGKIEWMLKEFREARTGSLRLSDIAQEIAEHNDPRAIPPMIGVISADNSYDTIYGVGYFGLGFMTGVEYSPYHDGAWWRRWWEANKSRYPAAADIPIPELPKTQAGLAHVDFPQSLDTFDGKLDRLLSQFRDGAIANTKLNEISGELADLKDPRCIPAMIGVIDADNSYDTVYGVGYFGLGGLTDVRYSPFHDGAWWRRWWERNKSRYPGAAAIPIPDLPRTAHGKSYTPMPESFDTLDGKIAWLPEALRTGAAFQMRDYIRALADHNDPRAIPTLLGLLRADQSEGMSYDAGYFGMCQLSGVKYAEQTAAWWEAWWQEHKDTYPEAARIPVPDLRALYAGWKRGEADREQARADAEFAGFPSQDLRADNDERKRFFLLGPAENQKMPERGWRLLLILPGGGGGADFHHFCRSIHREALPEGFVAAQLVAPVWSDNPNRTVWPTRTLNNDQAAFTTEDFIRAVVKEVSGRLKIDPAHVLALGWSSSGPALYCDSLRNDTPVTGWFIAMSVFRPQWMPDLAAAKGRSYFILHSPGDAMIPIRQHAEAAEAALRNAGASVKLVQYAGGHGWTEDPFRHIRDGVAWLESGKP